MGRTARVPKMGRMELGAISLCVVRHLYPAFPSVCFYPLRNEVNFAEILTLATKVSDSSRPLSPSCTRLTPIDRRYTALYQVLANPPPYACAKVTACLFCTSSA